MHGGADLLLMPSRFEPCGLTQMQAMRYGAIPVVTDVGGLHDTVPDADDDPDGTGFRAPEATSVAFTSALFRASRHLGKSRRRDALIARGMRRDWSWGGPARQYLSLYEGLLGRPG
jgi:starch synthase